MFCVSTRRRRCQRDSSHGRLVVRCQIGGRNRAHRLLLRANRRGGDEARSRLGQTHRPRDYVRGHPTEGRRLVTRPARRFRQESPSFRRGGGVRLESRDPGSITWDRWDRLLAARELERRRKRLGRRGGLGWGCPNYQRVGNLPQRACSEKSAGEPRGSRTAPVDLEAAVDRAVAEIQGRRAARSRKPRRRARIERRVPGGVCRVARMLAERVIDRLESGAQA